MTSQSKVKQVYPNAFCDMQYKDGIRMFYIYSDHTKELLLGEGSNSTLAWYNANIEINEKVELS